MLRKLFSKVRDTLTGRPSASPAKGTARTAETSSQPPAPEHPARQRFERRGGKPGAGEREDRERGRSGAAERGERGERPVRGGASAGGAAGAEGGGRGGREGGREGNREGGRGRGGRSERGGRGGRGGRGRGGRDYDSPAYDEPRAETPPVAEEPAAPPPDVPKMETAFTALGLTDALAYAVQEKGYTEPTPIQAEAVPVVLRGGDVIGSAQTGTGKTAAFALPILQRLGQHGRGVRCLILEPTRELALQVEQAFLDYGKFTNLRTTVIYGGVGYGKQTDALRRGTDVIVATPGRLLDHLEQRNCTLRDVEILVLDEVDRMLDMGFLPDVKRIVGQCPTERQTLFFTATLPPEIERLAAWALRDPLRIAIGRTRAAAETVAHAFYPVVEAQKFDLLLELLKRTDFKSVIIFCRTKMGSDRVAAYLKSANHSVGVMHADRSQGERTEALAGFKAGKYEVLVATDIAARGLDIAGVSHVINYDTPENPEDYVHRIGRTGRAQATGDAFTLVAEDDVRHARSIERFIGAAVEKKRLEGFNYTYSALFDTELIGANAAKPASRLHRGARR